MLIEDYTRKDLDFVLARGRKFFGEIYIEPFESNLFLKRFSRISKRKKLITLIALTDKENQKFVEVIEPLLEIELGQAAWFCLGYALHDAERITKLLSNKYISEELHSCITEAAKRGRLIDVDSKILNAQKSRQGCTAILQHGSLKQRVSVALSLSDEALRDLLINTEDCMLERAMNWAVKVA